MNERPNRRRFLEQSTRAAAITAAASTLGGVHSLAAEMPEKIRLGIIGCGGMMTGHVRGLVERGSAVSFASLCDVDPRQIVNMSKHVSGFQTVGPSGRRDTRRCWRTRTSTR